MSYPALLVSVSLTEIMQILNRISSSYRYNYKVEFLHLNFNLARN